DYSHRCGVLDEERHTVIKKNLIDVALTFADNLIQTPLPGIVALANAHRYAERNLTGTRFFEQRNDNELLTVTRRPIGRDRPTLHAGGDLAGTNIIHHFLSRIEVPAIDHHRITFDVAHQAILGDVVAAWRALHHADFFALQARVGDRVNTIEPRALFINKRRCRAVDRVGVEHDVITLPPTDHEIAFLGGQRHANEAHRLRKPSVDDRQLQLVADDLGYLVFEALTLLIGKRQVCRIGADAKLLAIDEIGSRHNLRHERTGERHS